MRDCILKVADIVCPEQKTKLRELSLSNDTVRRRVEDLANDLKEQLGQHLEALGKGAFSIALDESTDISDTEQLLIYIRTVTENLETGEELLSLESIKDRTRGVDICDAVCRSLDAYNVKLPFMVGVTTDGAPAMVGRKTGDTDGCHVLCHLSLDKNHNLVKKTQRGFRPPLLRFLGPRKVVQPLPKSFHVSLRKSL